MKDFEILFKEGKFVGGDVVTAKVWWVQPEKYPRREYSKDDLLIGFAVGKKVHKSAVKRNRIKRQMREVVRLLLKDDRLKCGAMLVFVAKPNIVGAGYEEIEKSVTHVLRKAKLLR